MVSSRMPKLAQASPVFSAPHCPLCVKPLPSVRPEKSLTQRTQRAQRRTTDIAGDASAADRIEIKMIPVMDSLELKILSAFDGPGARARFLSDFGDPAIVKPVALQLVERGWLRAMESPD